MGNKACSILPAYRGKLKSLRISSPLLLTLLYPEASRSQEDRKDQHKRNAAGFFFLHHESNIFSASLSNFRAREVSRAQETSRVQPAQAGPSLSLSQACSTERAARHHRNPTMSWGPGPESCPYLQHAATIRSNPRREPEHRPSCKLTRGTNSPCKAQRGDAPPVPTAALVLAPTCMRSAGSLKQSVGCRKRLVYADLPCTLETAPSSWLSGPCAAGIVWPFRNEPPPRPWGLSYQLLKTTTRSSSDGDPSSTSPSISADSSMPKLLSSLQVISPYSLDKHLLTSGSCCLPGPLLSSPSPISCLLLHTLGASAFLGPRRPADRPCI